MYRYVAATTTVDSPDLKQMTNPGLSKGAYAGIAVAVIIVIVVVVVVLLVVVRSALSLRSITTQVWFR